jgi:hypothetical protein
MSAWQDRQDRARRYKGHGFRLAHVAVDNEFMSISSGGQDLTLRKRLRFLVDDDLYRPTKITIVDLAIDTVSAPFKTHAPQIRGQGSEALLKAGRPEFGHYATRRYLNNLLAEP